MAYRQEHNHALDKSPLIIAGECLYGSHPGDHLDNHECLYGLRHELVRKEGEGRLA